MNRSPDCCQHIFQLGRFEFLSTFAQKHRGWSPETCHPAVWLKLATVESLDSKKKIIELFRWWKLNIPSGYDSHSHGKSPFFLGKPSINGPFSMAMLNNQRVSQKTTGEVSTCSTSYPPVIKCHKMVKTHAQPPKIVRWFPSEQKHHFFWCFFCWPCLITERYIPLITIIIQ